MAELLVSLRCDELCQKDNSSEQDYSDQIVWEREVRQKQVFWLSIFSILNTSTNNLSS